MKVQRKGRILNIRPRVAKPPPRFYLAYGSNLNISQMLVRCPKAQPVEGFLLRDMILRFRNVADMVPLHRAKCPVGLWQITPECEVALDRYEGVPNLYAKKYLTLIIDGKHRSVLYYQMRQRGIMPPSEGYYRSIAQGYEDFGLNQRYLERALEHSWNRKDRTPRLLLRYLRKGSPALARIEEDEDEEDWGEVEPLNFDEDGNVPFSFLDDETEEVNEALRKEGLIP